MLLNYDHLFKIIKSEKSKLSSPISKYWSPPPFPHQETSSNLMYWAVAGAVKGIFCNGRGWVVLRLSPSTQSTTSVHGSAPVVLVYNLVCRIYNETKTGAKNPCPYLKCCVLLFLYHLLCVFTSFTPWKVCTHPKLRTKLAGAPLGASQ